MMEHGQKLLGALELAGATLIAAGLTLHALRKRLNYYNNLHNSKTTIDGQLVLILGANNPLGAELASQFTEKGCRVAKVPSPITGSWKKDQLKIVAERVKKTFGDPDILVYVVEETVKSETNDPLERLSSLVTNDLKEHFHVVTQFVSNLAKRSGHFVTIGPTASTEGNFASTEAALTSLTDTITQQMAISGDQLVVTRAVRRAKRRGYSDSVETSAAAILDAIELGKTAITLPPTKEHLKNIFRHVIAEAKQFWSDMMTRQWKLAS